MIEFTGKKALTGKDLFCPLCGKHLTVSEGGFDNSGGYYRPEASCKCGFSYKDREAVFPMMGKSVSESEECHRVAVLKRIEFKFSRV